MLEARRAMRTDPRSEFVKRRVLQPCMIIRQMHSQDYSFTDDSNCFDGPHLR